MAYPIPFKRLFLLVLAPTWVWGAALSTGLQEKIIDAARRSSLDPKLVQAVIQVESNFKSNAESPKGAIGLMQMMTATADECGIHDRTHELNHLMGACLCLRKLINRYRGDIKLALAAYNAGPGAVDKYKGIPPYPETRRYVAKILRIYRSSSQN